MIIAISSLSIFYFIVIIQFISIFTKTINENSNNNKCSSALEQVIYRPETCAYQYLNKLHKEFLIRSPLLFTSQADAFIYSFESMYNVYVTLIDAMGKTTNYYYSNKTKSNGQPVKYTDTARSYINFPGFVRQVSSSSFYFTFVVFSVNAEMYSVTISMPLSQDPIFC